MSAQIHAKDAIHWYMSELTSRIVAETGIPSDRYHLGKVLLQSLKDAPDFVLQIDAKTGKSETSGSVLERSVRFALGLKKMGLKSGDVMAILGHNHLDMAVTFYGGLFLGVILAPLDVLMSVFELKEMFQVIQPKIVVCENDLLPKVTEALNQIAFKSHVVSFDDGTEVKTFSSLLAESSENDVSSFKPENIDPEDAISFLTSTSGSTGLPKAVSITHKNVLVSMPYMWIISSKFPYPVRSTFVMSPIQWMTATIQYVLSAITRVTRIQTPESVTLDVFVDIVNKYKPAYLTSSPTYMTAMMKPELKKRMDMSCFEYMMLGGSTVQQQLLDELKELNPNVRVFRGYGSSEMCGGAFDFSNQINGSVGTPLGAYNYRLVDPETLQNITEPFVTGELWVQGPSVFKGYYNNPELTKEVLLEDGWYRSGDMFYRDENYSFFFVDRLKMLLKYKSYHVSPTEIEKVIYTHPGVLDVAVTGIPDAECGDLPVACVVPRAGHALTAQEIKDLVKDTLSDPKQLRGGVIFMDSLPATVTTKVDRPKLKQLAKTLDRE